MVDDDSHRIIMRYAVINETLHVDVYIGLLDSEDLVVFDDLLAEWGIFALVYCNVPSWSGYSVTDQSLD